MPPAVPKNYGENTEDQGILQEKRKITRDKGKLHEVRGNDRRLWEIFGNQEDFTRIHS